MSMQQVEQKKSRMLQGKVVSDSRNKTITVLIETQRQHAKYKKIIKITKKFHAHDEDNSCKNGDIVEIMESRPLSKTKTWKVSKVISKAV